MSEGTCIGRIKASYNSLNSAEKKVAQYILENPRDIIHFSITELADSSHVSETTVFRLCNKIGYKGFQELKINLAGNFVTPMKNIHEEINEEDDIYLIMSKVLSSNIYSLENTMKVNSSEKIEEAGKIILKAKQLLFYGMGGSGVLAMDAYHKFVRTGILCTMHTDSHWQAMMASLAQENDVIVAFSNSGSNKELLDSINIGKDRGAKVILITSNAKSPIADASDIVLVSYGKESVFRSEAMESRVTALMLIDCLYIYIAINRKNQTLEGLDKIRKGIAKKRY